MKRKRVAIKGRERENVKGKVLFLKTGSCLLLKLSLSVRNLKGMCLYKGEAHGSIVF